MRWTVRDASQRMEAILIEAKSLAIEVTSHLRKEYGGGATAYVVMHLGGAQEILWRTGESTWHRSEHWCDGATGAGFDDTRARVTACIEAVWRQVPGERRALHPLAAAWRTILERRNDVGG